MSVKKIGKYTLMDEISRGGMGIVYKGMDEDLKRKLAIKMLPKEFFSNQEHKDRFILEAQIVAKLDHPNIMKVYSIEYAEDTVWIVMELLEGELLSKVIKEKAPLSVDTCMGILAQLAKALNYAHQKGIVHRDIKPANVFINHEGIVKLMDFGIARDEEKDLHLTRAGTIMGTPKYMSPEQFTGGDVDSRSDMFSLGVMAYEMLTGELPYQGKTLAELAYKVIHEPLPSFKKKSLKIPPDVEKMIKSLLEKKKELRPVNLSAFCEMGDGAVILNSVKKKMKFYYVFVFILFSFVIALTYIMWSKHSREQKVKTVKFNSLKTHLEELLDENKWIEAKGVISQINSLQLKKTDVSVYVEKVNALEKKEKDASYAKTLFADSLKNLSLKNLNTFNEDLKKVCTLDPTNESFFKTKAEEAIMSLKKRKAHEIFAESIKLLNEGKEKESNDALIQAIELNVENSNYFKDEFSKNQIAFNKSKAKIIFSKALEHMEKGEMEQFNSLVNEANELSKEDNFKIKADEALKAYRNSSAQEYYEKAIRFAGKNDIKSSNEELTKCIQLNPEHASAYYLLAENCLEEDNPNYNLYVNYVKKSLAIDPYNESAWDSLARYYSQINDKESAKDACNKGISYFKDSDSLKNLLKTL